MELFPLILNFVFQGVVNMIQLHI